VKVGLISDTHGMMRPKTLAAIAGSSLTPELVPLS
jgi:hypothetical protein